MSVQSTLDFGPRKESDRRYLDADWAPLKTTIVFDSYWKLAAERQRIFFARFRNAPPPWTDDPVLKTHRFTNAYRASDRVSQFLIRDVIYQGDQSPREVLFRTLLFKFFNRIETWKLLEDSFGTINSRDYRFPHYDQLLTTAMSKGIKLYSAAYIMPSGGGAYKRKHQMHLKLLEQMIADALDDRLTECHGMGDAFLTLRNYPTIGNFLAYQFITDLNYASFLNFTEMEYTCAGPGAKSGITKCFSDRAGFSDAEIIKMMCIHQEREFCRLGIKFQDLWGRKLQLIDCQNLFCEVDKYSRVAHPEITDDTGRTRIKQKFRAKQESLTLWYPPKWELNEKIETKAL